jgi:hypothetical protein
MRSDRRTEAKEPIVTFYNIAKKREPIQLKTHHSHMNRFRRYMLLQKHSVIILSIIITPCGPKAKISFVKTSETCSQQTALCV